MSKEKDALRAPAPTPLPPLSCRSIDMEQEEEGISHLDDIAFSDDPLRQAEPTATSLIPAIIQSKALDFDRLMQATQKVAETTLVLAESSRLALEGEGAVGELTFSQDPLVQGLQAFQRPKAVPAINMGVLWGELLPVLHEATTRSDLDSEQQGMLSTLREAAKEATEGSSQAFVFPMQAQQRAPSRLGGLSDSGADLYDDHSDRSASMSKSKSPPSHEQLVGKPPLGNKKKSVQAAQQVLGVLTAAGIGAEVQRDGPVEPAQNVASEVAMLKAEIASLRKAMLENANVNSNSNTVVPALSKTTSLHNKSRNAVHHGTDKRARKQSTSSMSHRSKALADSRGKVRPCSAGPGSKPVHLRQKALPKPGLSRGATSEMSGLLGQLQKWSDQKDRVRHPKRTESRPGSAQGVNALGGLNQRQAGKGALCAVSQRPVWKAGYTKGKSLSASAGMSTASQSTSTRKSSKKAQPKRKVGAKTPVARSTVFVGAICSSHLSKTRTSTKQAGRLRVA
eukprot:TRINITY_DN3702_c0_g1_i4.p1 TRINITY_DN3702_c0_g1~~TRINITY_DN3702_c0_g1_i4.p1  ORF type:complete len:509 (-),score=89.31 TRINITY_DN3702_c0_g1_i4:271-1797(-)